jgi:hypothetical protein
MRVLSDFGNSRRRETTGREAGSEHGKSVPGKAQNAPDAANATESVSTNVYAGRRDGVRKKGGINNPFFLPIKAVIFMKTQTRQKKRTHCKSKTNRQRSLIEPKLVAVSADMEPLRDPRIAGENVRVRPRRFRVPAGLGVARPRQILTAARVAAKIILGIVPNRLNFINLGQR